MNGFLHGGWIKIVIETEDDGIPIAVITNDNVEMVDGYAVRITPSSASEEN